MPESMLVKGYNIHVDLIVRVVCACLCVSRYESHVSCVAKNQCVCVCVCV